MISLIVASSYATSPNEAGEKLGVQYQNIASALCPLETPRFFFKTFTLLRVRRVKAIAAPDQRRNPFVVRPGCPQYTAHNRVVPSRSPIRPILWTHQVSAFLNFIPEHCESFTDSLASASLYMAPEAVS